MTAIITISTLTANSSFNGSGAFLKNPASSFGQELPAYILVIASSDQTGTAYVDQSVDGVNVARCDPLATSADVGPQGGFSAVLKVQVALPFYRVRYTNGSTNQTRFSLAQSWVRV